MSQDQQTTEAQAGQLQQHAVGAPLQRGVRRADGSICPHAWALLAEQRAPRKRGLTQWFDGTTHPTKRGWYERHFIDSQIVPRHFSMHWWDGKQWLTRPRTSRHWRQPGDYPAWRGLTCAAFMSPSRYPVARAPNAE